jgi:hypothetical protein
MSTPVALEGFNHRSISRLARLGARFEFIFVGTIRREYKGCYYDKVHLKLPISVLEAIALQGRQEYHSPSSGGSHSGGSFARESPARFGRNLL